MSILTILKGAAMGIAEAIPGVSGGTIAFITGIYETLLNSIKSFNPSLIGTFKEDGLKGIWDKINGSFLLMLIIGMGAGLVFGVFVITHLLEAYPVQLWAFFFGLILASSIYIANQITKWSIGEIVLMILGGVLAYYITIATPAQGNEALWYVFLSGVVAISALMLPGLSGSFILLLMGMYTYILPTVRTALTTFESGSLMILSVFAAGCLTGLLTFSHLLSWTFKNYRNLTLATLTGFMIGSLNKVWPWRNVISTRKNSKGELVPFLEQSVLPNNFDGDPAILGVIVLAIIGFAMVFLMERLGKHETA